MSVTHQLPLPSGMPQRIRIGTRTYSAQVFRVQDRYEDGRPENITYIPNTLMVELSDNKEANHFVICYAPDTAFEPELVKAEQEEAARQKLRDEEGRDI